MDAPCFSLHMSKFSLSEKKTSKMNIFKFLVTVALYFTVLSAPIKRQYHNFGPTLRNIFEKPEKTNDLFISDAFSSLKSPEEVAKK